MIITVTAAIQAAIPLVLLLALFPCEPEPEAPPEPDAGVVEGTVPFDPEATVLVPLW